MVVEASSVTTGRGATSTLAASTRTVAFVSRHIMCGGKVELVVLLPVLLVLLAVEGVGVEENASMLNRWHRSNGWGYRKRGGMLDTCEALNSTTAVTCPGGVPRKPDVLVAFVCAPVSYAADSMRDTVERTTTTPPSTASPLLHC